MRGGEGRRSWEHDFEGADEITEIMENPDAAERMEAELYTRLAPYLVS